MTGSSLPEQQVTYHEMPRPATRKTPSSTLQRIGSLIRRPSHRLAATGLLVIAVAGSYAESVEDSGAVNFPNDIPALSPSNVTLAKPDSKSSTTSTTDGRLKIPKIIINYANAPSGYPTGNLTDNDTFVYSGIKEKDMHKRIWKFGMMVHLGEPGDDECGWGKSRELKDVKVKYVEGICADQEEKLRDRKNIGDDENFNCGDHVCDDGKFTRTDCDQNIALNYNQDEGVAYDILPVKIPEVVYFRYPTLDHKKKWSRMELQIPGRNQDEGTDIWAPVPPSCIEGFPEGGPKLETWEEIKQKRD